MRSVFEVPHARADFFQQILVVRHEQHRALILLERHVQRVDRFQVQMVRRLVEHEHVGLLEHDAAEQQPRRLAARERLGRLETFFAAEEHLAEQAVDFLPRRVRVEAVQPFHRRQSLLDGARRILREVADRYLVSPLQRTRVHIAR